ERRSLSDTYYSALAETAAALSVSRPAEASDLQAHAASFISDTLKESLAKAIDEQTNRASAGKPKTLPFVPPLAPESLARHVKLPPESEVASSGCVSPEIMYMSESDFSCQSPEVSRHHKSTVRPTRDDSAEECALQVMYMSEREELWSESRGIAGIGGEKVWSMGVGTDGIDEEKLSSVGSAALLVSDASDDTPLATGTLTSSIEEEACEKQSPEPAAKAKESDEPALASAVPMMQATREMDGKEGAADEVEKVVVTAAKTKESDEPALASALPMMMAAEEKKGNEGAVDEFDKVVVEGTVVEGAEQKMAVNEPTEEKMAVNEAVMKMAVNEPVMRAGSLNLGSDSFETKVCLAWLSLFGRGATHGKA
ncbi:MAG: hypothetical protein SGPRY_014724, partial [Prymnesium sp.]